MRRLGDKINHLLEIALVARVIVVDVNVQRAARIYDSLEQVTMQAQIIISDPPTPKDWWNNRLFDRILLDVPCSATGVILRHPDIK